jgi:NADH:ubiquinone oxidoreductase subunit 4 (subunit M)
MNFETKANVYKYLLKLLSKSLFFLINNYIIAYIVCLFFLFGFILYIYIVKNNIVSSYMNLVNFVCYVLVYLYLTTLLVTMFYEFNNTIPYVIVVNLFFFLSNGFFLYMDGLSLLFILLLSFLVLICFVYYFYYTQYFMYIKVVNFKNSDIIIGDVTKNKEKIILLKHATSFCHASILYIILLLAVNLILFLLFLATDFLVFYILFESILVPLFLLIGIYGLRNNKVKAVYFLIFFTVIGSFFFIFGTMVMEYLIGSTSA